MVKALPEFFDTPFYGLLVDHLWTSVQCMLCTSGPSQTQPNTIKLSEHSCGQIKKYFLSIFSQFFDVINSLQ